MNTQPKAAAVSVEAYVASLPLGFGQIGVLAMIAVVMVVEGFDFFLAANVAPAVARDLGVAGAAIAPIMLMQQLGSVAGTMLFAPLADRVGRKYIIVTSLVAFACTTLAGTACHSVTSLAATRFITGVFLAGVLPNCVALAAEYAPRRLRATFVTFTYVGFALGSTAAAYFGSQLAALHGWRVAYVVGAALPFGIALLALWALPESVAYLASRNRDDPRVLRLVQRIDRQPLHADRHFLQPSGSATVATVRRGSVPALFRDGYAPTTIVLWLAFVLAMTNVALTGFWMPTLLVQKVGLTLQKAGEFGALISLASIFAYAVYGSLIDRFGARSVLAVSYLVGGLAHVGIGLVDWDSALRVACTILIGLTTVAAQSGLSAVAAATYPVAIRATGTSWASVAGRWAALGAPFLAAMLLGSKLSFLVIISIFGLPALLVVPLALLLPGRAPAAASVDAAADQAGRRVA